MLWEKTTYTQNYRKINEKPHLLIQYINISVNVGRIALKYERNFLKANFWIKAKNLNANNMYFLVYSPKITLHNVIEIHYVKTTKNKSTC